MSTLYPTSAWLQIQNQRYRIRLDQPRAISISLQFNGPQPSYLGVPPAWRQPYTAVGIVGDIQRGGSCNVDRLELIPHCHGTHTETVSHIAEPLVPIGSCWLEPWQPARLISVETMRADQSADSYQPPLRHDDCMITSETLTPFLNSCRQVNALVIRTLPNSAQKQHQIYDREHPPAFFSREAIECLLEIEIRHLVTDLPSIDRIDDGGQLSNHHRFWSVPPGGHQWTDVTAARRTVTEMAYVPDEVLDGFYALSVQLPDWPTDAAPSRPLLYPLDQEA